MQRGRPPSLISRMDEAEIELEIWGSQVIDEALTALIALEQFVNKRRAAANKRTNQAA